MRGRHTALSPTRAGRAANAGRPHEGRGGRSLAESGGNATLAAKKLGLHRTQLLRSKFGLTQPDVD